MWRSDVGTRLSRYILYYQINVLIWYIVSWYPHDQTLKRDNFNRRMLIYHDSVHQYRVKIRQNGPDSNTWLSINCGFWSYQSWAKAWNNTEICLHVGQDRPIFGSIQISIPPKLTPKCYPTFTVPSTEVYGNKSTLSQLNCIHSITLHRSLV